MLLKRLYDDDCHSSVATRAVQCFIWCWAREFMAYSALISHRFYMCCTLHSLVSALLFLLLFVCQIYSASHLCTYSFSLLELVFGAQIPDWINNGTQHWHVRSRETGRLKNECFCHECLLSEKLPTFTFMFAHLICHCASTYSYCRCSRATEKTLLANMTYMIPKNRRGKYIRSTTVYMQVNIPV